MPVLDITPPPEAHQDQVTTITLTLHTALSSTAEIAAASAFPRHYPTLLIIEEMVLANPLPGPALELHQRKA